MPKKQKGFFEKRSVVATFGVLAFLGASLFLQGGFTNKTTNAINSEGTSIISIVPIIGILLLICSIILIAYAVVKKN